MKDLIGIFVLLLLQSPMRNFAQAGACGGWQCQPSKTVKAKYATRPGAKGAFCDLPVFDSETILKHLVSDPDWRLKPFIIRQGSTLLKEGFAKESLVKHAKQRNIAAKYGHSWTIVQSNGVAEQEILFDEFVRDYMYAKHYDGSVQMERPYLFHDQSPLLQLRDTEFRLPASIQSLQTHSNLSFSDQQTSAALLIGAALSGIGFHRHGATVQMMAYGYKRWMLYPPERSPPGGDDGSWPIYDWINKVYPSLEKDMKPVECIQKPEDLIWIPELWFHATINLADTVAVSIQNAYGESEGFRLQRKVSMRKPGDPECIGYLKKMIKLQPSNVCAKADLVLSLIAQGKSATAEGLLQKVLKLDPFHMGAIVMLTATLDYKVDDHKAGAERKLESTLKAVLPTLEMNPRSYAATRLLSRYYELTRNRKSYEHYERRLDFFDQIGMYESDLFNTTMTFLGASQADQDL